MQAFKKSNQTATNGHQRALRRVKRSEILTSSKTYSPQEVFSDDDDLATIEQNSFFGHLPLVNFGLSLIPLRSLGTLFSYKSVFCQDRVNLILPSFVGTRGNEEINSEINSTLSNASTAKADTLQIEDIDLHSQQIENIDFTTAIDEIIEILMETKPRRPSNITFDLENFADDVEQSRESLFSHFNLKQRKYSKL